MKKYLLVLFFMMMCGLLVGGVILGIVGYSLLTKDYKYEKVDVEDAEAATNSNQIELTVADATYDKGEKIEVTIKNVSGKDLYWYSNGYYKMKDNDYYLVEQADCCGCIYQIEFDLDLPAGSEKKLSWNQEASWCDTVIGTLEEPKRQQVDAGTYRFVISLFQHHPFDDAELAEQSEQKYYVEFEID